MGIHSQYTSPARRHWLFEVESTAGDGSRQRAYRFPLASYGSDDEFLVGELARFAVELEDRCDSGVSGHGVEKLGPLGSGRWRWSNTLDVEVEMSASRHAVLDQPIVPMICSRFETQDELVPQSWLEVVWRQG